VTAFLTLLNIPRQPTLVLRVGDVPLGGEPGGIDASVLGITDQPWFLPGLLRLVDELLRHALFGKEFVDVLLSTRLDVGKFQRATPFKLRMGRPLLWCILLVFAWSPVSLLRLCWWIDLYEFFEGNLQAFVQQLHGFQPYPSLTMPEVPALLPTEARPMGELSDGVNIVAFQ
jgi:hypothetical protein